MVLCGHRLAIAYGGRGPAISFIRYFCPHDHHRVSIRLPCDATSGINYDFEYLCHTIASTHLSTAYQDTKGTLRVRRTYVSIWSSYSSIRSSYPSYAEVLRFLCVHLKILSTYMAGPIRRTYVTHTCYIRKQLGRYAVDT